MSQESTRPTQGSGRRTSMRRGGWKFVPLLTVLTFAEIAFAATIPRLRVNGVGAPDNSAVAHAAIAKPLTIDLRGTPNAKFALLFSIETNGAPNGFFLQPSAGPSPQIPIHSIFDGIGSITLASSLGLPPSALVPSLPNSLFQLDAAGHLSIAGNTPAEARLVDASNPGTPFVLALESPAAGPVVALYVQAVEIAPGTGTFSVGNGVRVEFDTLTFPATVSLAIATPMGGVFPDIEIGTTNSLVNLADQDLGIPGSGPAVVAPDFAGALDALDVFRIELAGIAPLMATSNWSNPTPSDPDLLGAHNYVTRLGSSLGVGLNGIARNNDNPQFPTIELPGGRALFHYRDRAGGGFRFGFGLHVGTTGEFLDLTPPSFGAFTAAGLGAPSPFETEVLISPAADRALVVLDAGTAKDRLFLLTLEPGATFSNGLAVVELALPAEVTRVFEESFDVIQAADGTWIALFATTNATSTLLQTTPPSHQRAVVLSEGASIQTLLPNSAEPTITILGRVPAVSADHLVACISAGPSAFDTDLFSVRATNSTTIQVTRCTNLQSGWIAPWGDATNGEFVPVSLTPDGSKIAFCRFITGGATNPCVAKTDGSTADPAPLVTYLSQGGLFDAQDFRDCRALHLTADGKTVLFAIGIALNGALAERLDLFAADVPTGTVTNLTRTIAGGSLFGPWDATGDLNSTRPTIEIGGTFVSDSGNWFYFFRENRVGGTVPIQFDLIGVSLEPTIPGPGGLEPSLELVNLTGNEFTPFPGSAPQRIATPSVDLGGSFLIDVGVGATRMRRFPASHPLAGHYVYAARRTTIPGMASAVLLTFDPERPAAARELTNFTFPRTGAPFPVISDFAIDPRLPRVACVVDAATSAASQDLFVVATDDSALPLPITNSDYTRVVTGGSLRFTPSAPSGLVFTAGSILPNQMQLDTVIDAPLGPNPIDVEMYFHRFALGGSNPAQTIPILGPVSPGERRALHLWSLR